MVFIQLSQVYVPTNLLARLLLKCSKGLGALAVHHATFYRHPHRDFHIEQDYSYFVSTGQLNIQFYVVIDPSIMYHALAAETSRLHQEALHRLLRPCPMTYQGMAPELILERYMHNGTTQDKCPHGTSDQVTDMWHLLEG